MKRTLTAFADSQLSYALGSTGRSFVIGMGRNPPLYPHHAGASCIVGLPCYITDPRPNPHVLVGGLVGGPDRFDNYVDSRQNYVSNEVTLRYNAPLTGLLARYCGALCGVMVLCGAVQCCVVCCTMCSWTVAVGAVGVWVLCFDSCTCVSTVVLPHPLSVYVVY